MYCIVRWKMEEMKRDCKCIFDMRKLYKNKTKYKQNKMIIFFLVHNFFGGICVRRSYVIFYLGYI